jgi:hypothetical protein
MRAFPFTVVPMLLALAPAPAAQAQSKADDQARVQYRQGIELFEDGKPEQAAVAFERAYELKPSWKILFNLGQVHNDLGHYAAALEAYTRYLADGGAEVPAERVAQVKTEIARLNALVGMIVVESEAAGATVFVDNRKQGEVPLPGPIFVDLGEHEVVVKLGATELHREVVKVAGGQRVMVTVAPTSEGEGASIPSISSIPSIDSATPDSAPGRTWTWVAAGIGGAGLVGAVVTGSLALKKKGEVTEQCDGKACPSSLAGDFDAVERLNLATDVLIGVAAAGAVAAVVLWFVEPGLESEDGAATVTAGFAPLPGGAAMTLGGRF